MDFLSTPAYRHFKDKLSKLEKLCEEKVLDEEGRYKGLDLAALYTSFEDLTNIFNHKAVKGTWVDIGGGSGRSCLLYSLLTKRSSINLELDPARANIALELAKEFHLDTLSLTCDLLTDTIPFGDTYFLYFPTGMVLDRVLDILSDRVHFTLVVIESHGDLIPRIEKEEGYHLLDKILLSTPRHSPFAHVYEKKSTRSAEVGPHQLSFRDELLLIRDNLGEWVADSKGLEWQGDDRYQFLHPPRAICWDNDFLGILDSTYKDYNLIGYLSSLRKLGEIKIVLNNSKEMVGVIRKIRTTPSLRLEISTTELVEWNQISKICKGSSLCYESSSCFFSLPAL